MFAKKNIAKMESAIESLREDARGYNKEGFNYAR